MKKFTISLFTLGIFFSVKAQVGVNTTNPQGQFNVDGGRDNPTTGTPTSTQQANDVVITSEGKTGIGTTTPSARLDVIYNNTLTDNSLLGISSSMTNTGTLTNLKGNYNTISNNTGTITNLMGSDTRINSTGSISDFLYGGNYVTSYYGSVGIKDFQGIHSQIYNFSAGTGDFMTSATANLYSEGATNTSLVGSFGGSLAKNGYSNIFRGLDTQIRNFSVVATQMQEQIAGNLDNWVQSATPITDLIGMKTSVTIATPQTGAITNAYGAYIKYFNGQSTNTVQNVYGLYLESTGNGGLNKNYSIYSNGGTSYFKDKVGIGTDTPTSKLQVVGLAEYADNAAALAGGLTIGAFYRTGDLLKVVH